VAAALGLAQEAPPPLRESRGGRGDRRQLGRGDGSGYEEALRRRQLWHEFGDMHLILPGRLPEGRTPVEGSHTVRCLSNRW